MRHEYDVIIIGGGLAGSALGKSLAEKGIRILILERESEPFAIGYGVNTCIHGG